MADTEKRRELPSVDQLLGRLADLEKEFPRRLIVAQARRAIEESRQAIAAGLTAPPAEDRVRQILEGLAKPS
ncbi:hypothetical protein, partial [Bradyrhizobium sp. NBAIM08]|uniref:hypothetical protein n=1 Tax=Bradyrhizobium sp. NBAIM08 TaxID=2793815 RepID=UPI001CD7E5F8